MFLLLMIAISLSLDAFSVALVLGVIKKDKSIMFYFSIIVGLLHFIMPSLGAFTNSIFFNKIIINSNIFLGIILLIIALSMIIDIRKENSKVISSSIPVLALSVSLDSYFAGIGLKSQSDFRFFSFFIFSIVSFIFSFLGCKLGGIGKDKLGNIASYIAIAILLLLSVKYILFN